MLQGGSGRSESEPEPRNRPRATVAKKRNRSQTAGSKRLSLVKRNSRQAAETTAHPARLQDVLAGKSFAAIAPAGRTAGRGAQHSLSQNKIHHKPDKDTHYPTQPRPIPPPALRKQRAQPSTTHARKKREHKRCTSVQVMCRCLFCTRGAAHKCAKVFARNLLGPTAQKNDSTSPAPRGSST